MVGQAAIGLRIEPHTQLTDRGIELVAEDEGGAGAAGGAVAFPDDVEDHALERDVAMMAVSLPAAGMNVHLHVPGTGWILAELDDGVVKIGSAFERGEARMKNPDRTTVQTPESIAEEALMLPNGLEEPFGGRIGLIVEERDDAAFQPPLGVEVVRKRQHLVQFFVRRPRESQAAFSASFLSLDFGRRAAKIERIERRGGLLI